MDWTFELVAGPFTFSEGPVWDGESVLFADIPTSRIMRYTPSTRRCDVYLENTRHANGLRMDAEGHLYACEGSGRAVARYERDGTRTVLADRFEGRRLNSPNDIAIDGRGRIWFTDPRYDGAGVYGDEPAELELDHQSVFRLDPRGGGTYAIHRVTYDTTKPNGLLISADERTLFVAQSEYGENRPRELRAYALKDDGSAGQYEVLHNFYPHRGIDGMTLDAEGNMVATAGWQTSGPGPMIYVFAPTGRVLETHPFPEDRPTNCTFGDADLSSLYVTCASGALYRARTSRSGTITGGIR
jgi:gluconolactonase